MATRVYRTTRWQRTVGIVLFGAGIVLLVAIWWQVLLGTREPTTLETSFSLVYCVFGAIVVYRDFHNTVSLSETSIQVRQVRGTINLPLDQIEGRRRYESQGRSSRIPHLVLVPRDDRLPRLDIEEIYSFDDFFYGWFNALPDLDERDAKRRPSSPSWGGSITT